MEGMDKITRKPIKITDTTFRDGHQSCLATRMRTEDMVPIAEELDSVGFHSVEMWGGATFDVTHRFLGEDPWERVRTLKRLMPKTPFQMLLRGQNLVAYRNHPDDLVEAFVEKSAEVGIDIFRCFDAVNDERNFETAFKVIKRCGKHIQGTICYSLTEPRMGVRFIIWTTIWRRLRFWRGWGQIRYVSRIWRVYWLLMMYMSWSRRSRGR